MAGPVVAGAVILCADDPIAGLADSKVLSPGRRSELAEQILQRSLAWSVAWADPAEIDRLNILQATLLAMRRAIIGLRIRPVYVEVDGNRLPDLSFHGRQIDGCAIVGGDARYRPSVPRRIAKVRRDDIMRAMDAVYPEYGFHRHKGYATADHRERLGTFGPCREHRRSFSPIATMIGPR